MLPFRVTGNLMARGRNCMDDAYDILVKLG